MLPRVPHSPLRNNGFDRGGVAVHRWPGHSLSQHPGGFVKRGWALGGRSSLNWNLLGRLGKDGKRAALRTLTMPFVFLHADRKAGDQAGDQSDGKLRDSKERWVGVSLGGGSRRFSSSGPLGVSFSPQNHPLIPHLWLRPTVYVDACLIHCVKVLQESILVFFSLKKARK